MPDHECPQGCPGVPKGVGGSSPGIKPAVPEPPAHAVVGPGLVAPHARFLPCRELGAAPPE